MVCSWAPTEALAQGTYSSRKTVTISPAVKGWPAPTVTLEHFEHAWAVDPTAAPFTAMYTVAPGQRPGYNINGYEGYQRFQGPGGWVVNRGNVVNSTAITQPDGSSPNQNALGIVKATQPVNGNFNNLANPFSMTASLTGGLTLRAVANTRFNVTAPNAANNQTLTAVMTADGSRTVLPNPLPPAAAGAADYAFSYTGLTYRGLGRAMIGNPPALPLRVTVLPTLNIGLTVGNPNVDPKTNFSFSQDPVRFTTVDSNGKTLVDGIAMEIHAGVMGNGQINWTSSPVDPMNHVHVASLGRGEELLGFSLDPTLVGPSNGGSYTLDVVDQTVVQASESGVFATLPLPQVGSSFSSLDLVVPSFDLTLTAPAGVQSYAVGVDDLGLTAGTAVPEPTAAILLISGFPLLALALYRTWRRAKATPQH
jgi:hypothetical protein